MCSAPSGAVTHRQDRRRRTDGVDNADDRLLRHLPFDAAGERKEKAPRQREGEGKEVGGNAVEFEAEQKRHRRPQRRHLRQREIDEDDAATDHVQPEVDVNAHQHHTGQKGPEQKLHVRAQGRSPFKASMFPCSHSR